MEIQSFSVTFNNVTDITVDSNKIKIPPSLKNVGTLNYETTTDNNTAILDFQICKLKNNVF